MSPHRIAVIPGDGIGPEVIPEALACLETVAAAHDVALETVTFDWGSERYLAEGAMMPADGPEQLAAFDAILFGAVGDPRIPDTVTGWGLLLSHAPDLRPVREPAAGVPVRRGAEPARRQGARRRSTWCVFRENTEGEYAPRRRARPRRHPTEVAVQTAVFTRDGIERIIRAAFEPARDHGAEHVTSTTKSNALRHGMALWDAVFDEVAAELPATCTTDSCLVDAASRWTSCASPSRSTWWWRATCSATS